VTQAAALVLAAALLAAACGAGTGPVTASPARGPLAGGRLSAIAFTGPRHGYGLFLRDPGARCQEQVARTADGGARFTALTAVVTWPCDRASPAAFLAADQSGDVFLYGPRLLVSHDSGATWSAPRGPGSGRSVVTVAAAGPRSVWLVTTRCGRPAGELARCTPGVFRSSDGGRSWRSVQPAGAGFRAVIAGFSGQSWLVPAGRRGAYLLARPAVNPRGRADRVPLWFTRNDGTSWYRRWARCGFDALYATAAVAPDGALFVACAGEPGAGNQEKSVARSADGGLTWSRHRLCPRRPMTCPPLSDGYLSALAAASGRDVYLGGDRSAVLASHDGGARWGDVRPLLGDGAGGTFAITFFGPRQGLVLGDDPAAGERPAIWHTSDGGLRWHPTHPAVS